MSELKHRNVKVSPRLAKEWLATNRENRNVSSDWVDKLARDMRNGQFPNIGEAIKFDRNGDLIDGQHRLMAVVQSGCTVEFTVTTGVQRDDRYKLDKGRKRSAADELHMKHGIPSGMMAVAAARIVLIWQIGETKSEKYKPTDAEIVEFVVDNRDLMTRAVRYGTNLRNEVGVSPSIAAAMFFLTWEIQVADALAFWESVHKGAGLAEGDPALTLRNALVRACRGTNPPKPKSVMAMIASAWNAERTGRKIKRLMLRPTGELTDESFKLA